MTKIKIKMTHGQKTALDLAIGDRTLKFGLISQPTMRTKLFNVLVLTEREFNRLNKYMKRFIPKDMQSHE